MRRCNVVISEKNFVGFCCKHRMKLSKTRVKTKGFKCVQCFHVKKLSKKRAYWEEAERRFKKTQR